MQHPNIFVEERLRARCDLNLLPQRLLPTKDSREQIIDIGGLAAFHEIQQLNYLAKSIGAAIRCSREVSRENLFTTFVFPNSAACDSLEHWLITDCRDPTKYIEDRFGNGAFQPKPMHIAFDRHLTQVDGMTPAVRRHQLRSNRTCNELLN